MRAVMWPGGLFYHVEGQGCFFFFFFLEGVEQTAFVRYLFRLYTWVSRSHAFIRWRRSLGDLRESFSRDRSRLSVAFQ